MRIRSFWAKGYRSLVDFRLDGLGQRNVFYGPNGAGKSNIVAAIDTFFRLVSIRADPRNDDGHPRGHAGAASMAIHNGVISQRDRARQIMGLGAEAPTQTTILGATLEESALGLPQITVEITIDWARSPSIAFTQISDGVRTWEQLAAAWGDGSSPERRVIETLSRKLATFDTLFELVGAKRFDPRRAVEREKGGAVTVREALEAGAIAQAIFLAKTGPDATPRERLEILKRLLEGPPLARHPLIETHDPQTNTYELREVSAGPPRRETPLDLAGLGMEQVTTVLARTVLSGARIVAIEEPEANLHAPTTGRALREPLLRVVREGTIDQLFVTTHSNIFDLDETGYFDVERTDPRVGTRVTRKANHEIDAEHLYEPGPAKHVLREVLATYEPSRVVYRDLAGGVVSAEEMLRRLDADDDVALAYLRQINDAAVHMAGLRARQGAENEKPT